MKSFADIVAEIEPKLNLKLIWDDLYYVGKPIVTDAVYDVNKENLKKLFVELDETGMMSEKAKALFDKFTATSYSRLENTFGDIKHDFPMTSLAKTNDLTEFYGQLQKWKAAGARSCILMWKVDGSSSGYRYKNSVLSQVVTRHTGELGKDLTVTGYQIQNLPKKIKESDNDHDFEVRGEMVIFGKDFEEINNAREAQGLNLYQNARNAVAGVSQTKDAKKISELHLSTVAYDVLCKDHDFGSHEEKLLWLEERGFKIVNFIQVPLVVSFEDLEKLVSELEKNRFVPEYEVDGLVAMVNETKVREALGLKSNVPEYAYAFKFKDVEIEFDIDDSIYKDGIEWCFGSTGVITPRAHFKENPVSKDILGVSIRHSTLHNVAELKRIGWKVGVKKAVVKRAGLVIPKVVRTLGADEMSNDYPAPPSVCPACGGATGFQGEIFKCLNDSCEGKTSNRILRFIESMEIDDIGRVTLEKIEDEGLVKGPDDLYKLDVDQLLNLDRLGMNSATKIINNIEKSKSQPFWRVLAGLMIPGLGRTMSKVCAKKWKSLDNFYHNVNYEELIALDNVGEVVATNIMKHLQFDELKRIIESLIELGLGQEQIEEAPKEGALKGLTFCLTGSPEINGQKAKKKILEQMIIDAGGTIASMGKTLNYLVAGPDSLDDGNGNVSNKVEKARSQGTKIITGDEVVKMIN
jgi:DNA ligase (NAD+)